MKILHVSPTYYSEDSVVGGGEKYIVYMVRSIVAAANHAGESVDNTLLAFGDKPGKYLLSGDTHCLVMQGTPWEPCSVDVQKILDILDQYDIVLVHQCLTAFGMFVASHAKLAGKIVVGIDEGGGEHPLVSHTSEACTMFDLFLAYSRFCQNSFVELSVPVKLILGPVDTSYYCPMNIKRVPKLVVAVGRLLPHKGFDRIIRALPKGGRLIIAGSRSDQGYFNYLHNLISNSTSDISIREGLSDEEVRLLMQNASLFVHASTHFDYTGTHYAKPELLGLAPLEALACGTPTLVSNAGSLGELGAITGCRVFSSNDELAIILKSFVNERSSVLDPLEINRSVTELYGIQQFGDKLLIELKKLGSRYEDSCD